MFVLDSQLEADTVPVGDLPLSLLLLSRDANYPWYILVPRREAIREIYQLDKMDQKQLLEESCLLSEAMEAVYEPLKLNVAALGNIVAQLHLHHIARYESDAAWPKPIWGVAPPTEYAEVVLQERVNMMRDKLAQLGLAVD